MRSLILAALLLGTAACSEQAAPPPEPSAEETIAKAEQQAERREETVQNSEGLSDAQEFIDEIAVDGTVEIGMAKIAAEQASRDEVKAFAEQAITFNQSLLQDLSAAAGAAGALQVNTVLSDEVERNFAQLRGARSIDDMYLERTRERYEDMAEDLSEYAAEGEVAALKDWAAKAVPMLQDHRDELAAL